MTEDSYSAGFYTSLSPRLVPERLVRGLEQIGFEIRDVGKLFDPNMSDSEYGFDIPFEGGSTTIRYTTDSERGPAEPAVRFTTLTNSVSPQLHVDDTEYQRRMDSVFETICRLSVALEAEYVALVNAPDRGTSIAPYGRPIADNIEQAPRLGVYADSVIADAGGIDGLYETTPWYTADLKDDRTVVIETEQPWAEGGWQPPTDASFIENAQFH